MQENIKDRFTWFGRAWIILSGHVRMEETCCVKPKLDENLLIARINRKLLKVGKIGLKKMWKFEKYALNNRKFVKFNWTGYQWNMDRKFTLHEKTDQTIEFNFKDHSNSLTARINWMLWKFEKDRPSKV